MLYLRDDVSSSRYGFAGAPSNLVDLKDEERLLGESLWQKMVVGIFGGCFLSIAMVKVISDSRCFKKYLFRFGANSEIVRLDLTL